MKIVINFGCLKTGGGQNVALNFMHSLSAINLTGIELFFIVADGSEIHKYLLEIEEYEYFIVPSSAPKRILCEIFYLSRIFKKKSIDVIYTYFGFGAFFNKIPQVVGCADSNLFYPKIDFWCDFKGINRLKKFIIDKYRIFGLKRSSYVVFENKSLEVRAKSIYNLDRTCTIKPSIYVAEYDEKFNMPSSISTDIAKGLFLCGWQPNKNYSIIPELALKLKYSQFPMHFLLSAKKDGSNLCNDFVHNVNFTNVNSHVHIVGVVSKSALVSLYSQVDFVFLLSKLESFSNNIIEAWYLNKVLIIADEPWARSLCGNAACYVNRDDPDDIVSKIQALLKDKVAYNLLLENGHKNLAEYPSPFCKAGQEINLLKSILK